MSLLDQEATRYLFFTGKGGVGKTITACATAIRLARNGRKVLLVSTDPASNLEEVLEAPIGDQPTPLPGIDGLWALNIDPMAAAAGYRERVLAPYRGAWEEREIQELEEQLSGACTVEIAAFDEFASLLTSAIEGHYDHLVFDTAPTGHTLRLLQLPSLWTSFLEQTPNGASCLGPHSGLKTEEERFREAFAALRNHDLTTVVLVTRPENTAIAECARAMEELRALGIQRYLLVMNAVFQATDHEDRIAVTMERRMQETLAMLPASLEALPRVTVPMKGVSLVGLDAVETFFEPQEVISVAIPPPVPAESAELPRLVDLIDELTQSPTGLIMVMGKGGVGKTTVAATIAVELASRGLDVHLTTTDPAGRLEPLVREPIPSLEVSRIDPAKVTAAYVENVMATKGKGLDADALAALEEDLRSPCTEEIAVFHAFSRVVWEASRRIVIVDTAPTGHTLLLLDATGSYHREVLRNLEQKGFGRAITPLMRLQDPAYTRIIVVTLPETTPVSEAAELQADLRRAGIEPWAWVMNRSLAATGSKDPLLLRKVGLELQQVHRVRDGLSQRLALVPWMVDEPVGQQALRRLAQSTK